MLIIFILVLFSIVPCAYADNAITLDAYAAWDGYIKSDAQEEITLRMHVSRTLPVKIKVRDSNNTLVTHTILFPYKTNVAKLEMPNIEGERLYVSITSSAAKTEASTIINLYPIQKAARLIAVATNNPDIYNIVSDNSRYNLVSPSMALFPDNPQAYDSISAIIIDNSTFSNFTDRQLSALQQYASTCGSILTYHLNKLYLHALKNNSYCNANNIRTLSPISLKNITPTHTHDDARQIMRQILENRALHYISTQFLLGIAIIMIYFAIILCIAYFSLPIRFFVYGTLLSTAAIYAYYTYLYQGQLETNSLIKINQYGTGTQDTQLIAIGGRAIMKTMTLPSALGIACPTDSNLAYRLHYLPNGEYQISYKQSLLAPHQFYITGPISYRPAIHVIYKKNKLWLKNISDTIIPRGILKWGNDYMLFRHLPPHSLMDTDKICRQCQNNIFAEAYGKLLQTCRHCALLDYAETKTIFHNKSISSNQVILVYLQKGPG